MSAFVWTHLSKIQKNMLMAYSFYYSTPKLFLKHSLVTTTKENYPKSSIISLQMRMRPGRESNPRIEVLQTPALPLGDQAHFTITDHRSIKLKNVRIRFLMAQHFKFNSKSSSFQHLHSYITLDPEIPCIFFTYHPYIHTIMISSVHAVPNCEYTIPEKLRDP